MNVLLGVLMILSATFLILLILVQRGRGGGLAGALGGMGGQSAFGTKAGDLFTRVTIWTAAFWIFLLIVSVKVMGSGVKRTNTGGGPSTPATASSKLESEGKADDKKLGEKDAASGKETPGSGAAEPKGEAEAKGDGAAAPTSTPASGTPAGGAEAGGNTATPDTTAPSTALPNATVPETATPADTKK